ncbi:MAG: glycosyltransferase family 9 protein [Candidatus Thorarchaeota archaeon]|jgi:ADP-heptose:LPS heptosyltransferase
MEIDTGKMQIDNMNTENIWDNAANVRDIKNISKTRIREFGLDSKSLTHVSSLEELKESAPNIIIAEAKKNVTFVQNFFKEQRLKKKSKYVMGLGVFRQLQFDSVNGKKLLKPSPIKFKNIYRPYNGQDLDNKSILVFRTGGIGDLLFIKPNLNYLKEKYPTCTVNFACGPQYQAMVETWDCVDNLLDLPFNFRWLHRSNYHVLYEGVIERCKEAQTSNAFNLFSKWMGLNLPDELLLPQQDAKEHLTKACSNVLNDWGVELNSFLVMQLRASSPIRTPRHEFWVEMMDRLTDKGYKIILTDNPRQNEAIEKFTNMVKNKDMVFNFCKHSKSLDYTIALVNLAKGVVATDSALNHIAASLNKKCFGIYGPFPGFIRLKTYPLADWIDTKMHCVPCYIHGHKPCPQAGKDGYSPCYDKLDMDKLVEKIGRHFEDD